MHVFVKRAWLIRAPCSNCINRDFGPSVDQDSWHTYSRQRTLNKRGALTLWHNESNTLSDRTIFTVRIDSALSDDRRLCSTTLSWYTLIRTHCDATNAPRANDLDVHICLSRNDFTKAPETRTGTWCTRLLCQPGRTRWTRKIRVVAVATTLRQLSQVSGGASSCDECVESAERPRIETTCARARTPRWNDETRGCCHEGWLPPRGILQ